MANSDLPDSPDGSAAGTELSLDPDVISDSPSPPQPAAPRGINDFGPQPTSTSSLDDPRPLMVNLAIVLVEALAGARNSEQIARWLSPDAYAHSLKRTLLSTRALRARGVPLQRPRVSMRAVRACDAGDGIVEGTVILNENDRVTAVAIRMRGLDKRWQVESIHAL